MTARCFISIVLSGGMLLAGCKTKSASKTSPADNSVAQVVSSGKVKKSTSEEEVQMRAEAMARFATGISYELNDEPELALDEYYKSASMDPANTSLVLKTSHRLIDKKQYDKAIELLSRATNRTDAAGGVFAMLARAQVQAGATNQAIAASQTALQKAPDALVAYQNLAEIYHQLGKTNELLKVLEQGSKQRNVDEAFLVELADLYVKFAPQETKTDESVRSQVLDVLQRASEKRPQSPTLLHKMADAYNQAGEREKSAQLYQQLLDKYSDLPVFRDLLRERLANIFLSGNEKGRAAEQYEAMIRDNPTKYPQVYYVLGTLAFEQKQFSKAEEYFGKAILFGPQVEQVYYDLAATQLNLNKATEALQTLAKAKEKFTSTFIGEFYSGMAQQKLKNYNEAMRHYTAAEVIANTIDSNRLDHSFFFQLGACAERNKDYQQAEKYFSKALELKPDEPETLNYLGYMWAERGEKLEKARELIEKAVKIEPDNAAFLDSFGWVLFKLNQPQQALVYLLKAVELTKEPDPTVYDHLGDVYSALKQPDKAREFWQKSVDLDPNTDVKKKLGLSL